MNNFASSLIANSNMNVYRTTWNIIYNGVLNMSNNTLCIHYVGNAIKILHALPIYLYLHKYYMKRRWVESEEFKG